MSKKSRTATSRGAMLDLWRPPRDAGEPVGCLASTYTFTPALFDEQCLARFLDIDSEPNREDLAFLLERERQLDRRYAGILVDHTQAGVEHSLRWDVLPVRIRAGKQHAKLTLLAWSALVRVVVASANVSESGYRVNQEVAAAVDLTPDHADLDVLDQALAFLRSLVGLVQGASENPPEVVRARAFLNEVERHTRRWTQPSRRGGGMRQQLTCTLPPPTPGGEGRSSLVEVMEACRRRGGAATTARVASPFFDVDDQAGRVTAELCRSMARGRTRHVSFSVPSVRQAEAPDRVRLAAPKTLWTIPWKYNASVDVHMLPEKDGDKNLRPWHAKMLALSADGYTALMIGSSNFTCAGMGIGQYRNAEANLLTIAEYVEYGRDPGRLEAVWPDVQEVEDPDAAEWLGPRPDPEENELAKTPAVPAGFLSATYCAGETRHIVLRFDPDLLPDDWAVHACGRHERQLANALTWTANGRARVETVPWELPEPPDRLLIRWGGCEAFLPLNVEDSRHLPTPSRLKEMTADDMLLILAASDPSAATRSWARRHSGEGDDTDLDTATPIDLDPLRRYDLQATFLHRIRRRARVLAQLRQNLERPVWGRQGLDWRLRGLIGVEALADRLANEYAKALDGRADEALLTLADFLIVLREVDYKPADTSLPKAEFDKVVRDFLRDLVANLDTHVKELPTHASTDVLGFWKQVVNRCAN